MSGVAPIVVASSDATSSVLAYRSVLATQQGGGGGGGGVTQIVGGTGVTVTPAGGTGVVTIAATASGGVTSIASANANLTVSPGGGTGAVTLTVPTQAVPNPLLDASLGINTTGAGATAIGSTVSGAVSITSPTATVNAAGTGTTDIGSTTSGAVSVTSPRVTINTTGSGFTTIGNTSKGVSVLGDFGGQTVNSVYTLVTGTAPSSANWVSVTTNAGSTPATYIAAAFNGFIYRIPSSTGVSIAASPSAQNWSFVATNYGSTSNNVAIAGVTGGKIWKTANLTSTNFSEITTSPSANWTFASQTVSGGIVATSSNAGIYASSDSITFTQSNAPTGENYTYICGSGFGANYLYACTASGKVYTNTDSAYLVWVQLTGAPAGLSFTSIAGGGNPNSSLANFVLYVTTTTGTVYVVTTPTATPVWTLLPINGNIAFTSFLSNTTSLYVCVATTGGLVSYLKPGVSATVLANWQTSDTGSGLLSAVAFYNGATGLGIIVGRNTGALSYSVSAPFSFASQSSLSLGSVGPLSIGGTSTTTGDILTTGNLQINYVNPGGPTFIGRTNTGIATTIVGGPVNINNNVTAATNIGTGNNPSATTIGNIGYGTVSLLSPALTVNTSGTGTTTIGSTTGGAVTLRSSTSISINSTGTGNTNIGSAAGGTVTFAGTVVGLPATSAPPYASYQAPTGSTALSVGGATTIPLSTTTVFTGGFFLNTATNAFRINQSGYLRITLLFGIQNLASQPGRFAVLLDDGTPIPNTTQGYLATNTPSPNIEGSTYTYSNTLPYTSGTYITAKIFAQDISLSLSNSINPAATLFVECLS